MMASRIFLFIPQLFGALVLGWECHAVSRHGGALYNGSLTTEAKFQDICASPTSSYPGDCCLPPNEMLPVDQCLTSNGTVGDPYDEAAMAGAFPASMCPYAAALLWQGGYVTGHLSPDVHCASSASSAAPIASQLKASAPNEIFSGHGRTTGMMASRIFLFIPQLFGALVLGWECHAVSRHGGALYNGSLTTEAKFQDICASPTSSYPGDCCLPPNEMLPVDQCLTSNGTVGDPYDEAAMAGAFPASMCPYAAALLWQGGYVTGHLSPDVHCASSASSAAPIASQLKASAPNEIFSGHGRTTGMMASRIFLFIPQWTQAETATFKPI
ncbi:uncharacterized protein [Dermacentor albipictus]|uniref:uncharacterized protein isoform X1 n=1 Tax=Dermacentor albipictus TaxID=60249 RepID=UPI0038FCDE6D